MARVRENLCGQQFGRLTVLYRAPNQGKDTAWLCVCRCSNTTIALSRLLKNGQKASCGCLQAETRRENARLMRERVSA